MSRNAMPLARRRFLQLGAGALVAAPGLVRAQNYPARPLRFVVGFTPGGATDLVARVIGNWLSERLGQPVVISGRGQALFDLVPNSLEHIRAGQLGALGVTTAARADALPDVPVAADTVPGYEASGWFGVGVARGTPAGIIATLNREINGG